jgi:hypothetical protein|tara:strand:+ start:1062 stop:1424 length:363 start_codon:yes stop_codon:yes gene_type:complete
MTTIPKTVEETGYDTMSLTKYQIGGQDIGLTRSEQLLHIAGEDWTLNRWMKTVERVNKMLVTERWMPDPRKNGVTGSHRGSSNFLTHNHQAIVAQTQGRMKRAPWWLRWLYSAVITKEQL